MKVLFLGCGTVGGSVIRRLAKRNHGIDFVIADIDLQAAETLATEIGGKTQSVRVDIHDPQSIATALSGVQLVFNAVGPFYRSALPVIEAALEAKVDYIDINDDHDVAEKLFLQNDFHQRSLDAGIKLIIGCGSTPGLTNLMARALVDRLDTASEIHLSTAVPFVPSLLSPSVIDHMMHITAGEVVQFLDGQYCMEQGWGGRKVVPHTAPFKDYPTYYIGHGETITLPHFISGLDQVTNRIGFFPEAGNEIWRSFINLGFADNQAIEQLGISPLQFMMAYLPSDAGAKALAVDLADNPWGVVGKVEVIGTRNNNAVCSTMEYQIELPTQELEDAPADPTPICALLAIEAYLSGNIRNEGLLAPEACIDAETYIENFAKESGARIIEKESVTKERSDKTMRNSTLTLCEDRCQE